MHFIIVKDNRAAILKRENRCSVFYLSASIEFRLAKLGAARSRYEELEADKRS